MVWGFWLIELSAYAFFIAALYEGFTASLQWGVTVLAAAFCGLAIELMFVHLAGGYEYGRFAIMFMDAPLWVACGWAFIIYYSMRAAESLDIAGWARPFAAACMATGLDLALDILAEHQGWWHWKREHTEWFGVSYDNYVGWLMIVGCFAGFTFGLSHFWGQDKVWKQVLPPLLAIPGATLVVGGAQFLWEALYSHVGEGPVFLGLYLTFLALPHLSVAERFTARTGMVVYFNLLFVVVSILGGVTTTHPEMYGVLALVTCSSLFWYTAPEH